MSWLRVSDPARRDLQTIWANISAHSVGSADRMIDILVHRCELIAEFPQMAPERPELAVGLRSFPVRNYLIFYPLIHEGIEVVRALHGARDLPALFTTADYDLDP